MRGSSWALSWACSDGLAGLSWGHWALLWAKFGVWRVAFGGWGQKLAMLENIGKTRKIWPNIGPFCAPRVPISGVVQRQGAKVGYTGLSKV